MKDFFHRLAHRTAESVGLYRAFIIAILVVTGWLVRTEQEKNLKCFFCSAV